jgi:ribonuclease HI
LLEDTTCAIFLVYSCNLDGVGADDLRLQTSGYRWIKMTEVQQYNVDQSSHFVLSQIDVLKERLKGSASDSELDSYVAEKSTKTNELVIYTDGGARGNPGPSASGFVIMTTSDEVLEEGGEYIGITTNNQAEYQAVKLALIAAKKYHPQRISFRMDSELVVRQMTGDYQITNRDLWPVHTFITEAMKEFKRVDFTHVRRELNRAADAKVNEILDAHERQERSH